MSVIPVLGRLRRKIKSLRLARHQWLTPVILATQEAEIRRIMVRSQPGRIVGETLSQKKLFTEKGWWSGSSTEKKKKRSSKLARPISKERKR
jgi:hypothetical protein